MDSQTQALNIIFGMWVLSGAATHLAIYWKMRAFESCFGIFMCFLVLPIVAALGPFGALIDIICFAIVSED